MEKEQDEQERQYYKPVSDAEKQNAEYVETMAAKYALVFYSGYGLDVLLDILAMCGFHQQIGEGDASGVALHNLALAIVRKVQIGRGLKTERDALVFILGLDKPAT